MHDTGCLGLVHWDDPEGWYGEGGERRGSGWGTRVHLWQIHVDVWPNQYNIVISLQLSKIILKKKVSQRDIVVQPGFRLTFYDSIAPYISFLPNKITTFGL